MATQSSFLAWGIPGQRSLAGAKVHGVTKESDTTQHLNNNCLLRCFIQVHAFMIIYMPMRVKYTPLSLDGS